LESLPQILDRGDYTVKVLEEDDYTLEEAHQRENFYIDNFDCVNKQRAGIPGMTRKEYYEANKETILEKDRQYSKKYREANKETIKEKKKLS
jgi:hypothetical protein